MSRRDLQLRVVAAFLMAGAAGCEPSSSGGVPTPSPGSSGPQATQAQLPQQAAAPVASDVSMLDDPGVAAVLESVHGRIAEQAKVAERTSLSTSVKQLSRDMGALHSDVLTSEQGLFQRLNVAPRPTVVSQQIDSDTTSAIEALRNDRPGVFDREYLEDQSRAFREAIDLFDRMYAVAKAPELRSEIARNRPDLVAGMQAIVQLQQAMNPGITERQGP
jgi:predicted outer membrane protein